MALSRKIYWAVVAATLAVFGVMVLLIAPKISAGAGGRLLFDEQLSYSHAYAVEFVGALTNEARALYLVELRLLDTLFPILLAICLTVGVARLTHGWKLRNRAIAVIPPLLGAFFDLMENAAVAAMLSAAPGELTADMARDASLWTSLKWMADLIAFAVIIALVFVEMTARLLGGGQR
jgi:hypothetical protein